MFSKLTTKLAMRKAGIPSNAFDVSALSGNTGKPGSKDPNAPNELLPFANPFANLQVPKSWQSWATPLPAPVEVAPAPVTGARAPNAAKLQLPPQDRRSTVVLFLRNTGCACMSCSPVSLRIPLLGKALVSRNRKPANSALSHREEFP